MKPSELFVAKISPDGKSILVSGYQGDQLHFLGSNLTVNVRPGDYVNYFTIHPAENQTGIVAVAVSTHRYGNGKNAQTLCFFLSVTWNEGKPRIDLENPWLPASGRIGQVGHSFVEVQIGNRYFTNYEYRKGPNTILLNDPNLLCRYLIGEVGAIDVIAAAAEPKFEESARKRLAKAETDNADLRWKNSLLQGRVENAEEVLADHEDMIVTLNTWKSLALRLATAVSGQFLKSKAVKNVLAEIKREEWNK